MHEAGKAVCERLARYSAAIHAASTDTCLQPPRSFPERRPSQPRRRYGTPFVLLSLSDASVDYLTTICRHSSYCLVAYTGPSCRC